MNDKSKKTDQGDDSEYQAPRIEELGRLSKMVESGGGGGDGIGGPS